MIYYRIKKYRVFNLDRIDLGYVDNILYTSQGKAERALQELKERLKDIYTIEEDNQIINEVWERHYDFDIVYLIEGVNYIIK